MLGDAYGFKRLVRKYEIGFEKNSARIFEEKDFHIEQLKIAISNAEEMLNCLGEEIADWAEALQEVYEVDDADTWWKKIELKIMKVYVNHKYSRVLDESKQVGEFCMKLKMFLNRLEILKAF